MFAAATALPNVANDIGCTTSRSRSATALMPCAMMPPTLPTAVRIASGSARYSPAMGLLPGPNLRSAEHTPRKETHGRRVPG